MKAFFYAVFAIVATGFASAASPRVAPDAVLNGLTQVLTTKVNTCYTPANNKNLLAWEICMAEQTFQALNPLFLLLDPAVADKAKANIKLIQDAGCKTKAKNAADYQKCIDTVLVNIDKTATGANKQLNASLKVWVDSVAACGKLLPDQKKTQACTGAAAAKIVKAIAPLLGA